MDKTLFEIDGDVRTFAEIEREATQIRNEFIREIAGDFGRFLKRKIGRIVAILPGTSAAEAK